MTFLRDSCALSLFSSVFFILCLCKHGNENGNGRMIDFFFFSTWNVCYPEKKHVLNFQQ